MTKIIISLVLLMVSVCANTYSYASTPRTIPAQTNINKEGIQKPTNDQSVLEQKDVIDIAFKQIDFEAHRLDRLISNAETVGSMVATFILAFAGFISFIGFKNISDLKKELQESVENYVSDALKKQADNKAQFDELANKLNDATTRWEVIKTNLGNLDKFVSMSGSQYGDAQGAYRIVSELNEKKSLTEDERKSALGLLLKVIELGEQGKVDPNLLFNCSTLASSLDFDFEALKLITLCTHFDSKPSHMARLARIEDVFGMKLVFQNGSLSPASNTPFEVRSFAWDTIRKLIDNNPIYQCELIYSEFHNIATRNRESGYMDEGILALERITNNNPGTPSYPHVILAGFYAERGNTSWKKDLTRALDAAIEIVKSESKASTWHTSTNREIIKLCKRLDLLEEFIPKLASSGQNQSETEK